MIWVVILSVLTAWLLVSLATTVIATAVVRGGQQEDRVRGFAPGPR
jgi:hypothetical protein